MGEVVLDLTAVPERIRQERARAWAVACEVAGVAGRGTPHPREQEDLVVRHAPDGVGTPCIPFDERFDGADPTPDFPSWERASGQGARASIDLVGLAAFFLAHREETARCGNGDTTFTAADCADPRAYQIPWSGVLARWIIDRVAASAKADGRRAARIRCWPRGDHAYCITSDADEIRWSWRRKVLMAATRPWRLWGKNAYWNIPEMARRVETAGMRGTFFVGFAGTRPHDIQYVADDVAGPLRALIDAGHEVGLHGSLGTATDAAFLGAQRGRLERLLDHPVVSTRQHYLDFDVEETWSTQALAGFQADSTAQVRGINGFKHGAAHPFRVPGTELVEVPPVVMDSYLLSRGRTETDAWAELQILSERVRAVEGVLVVNWHNEWYHARDHPRHFRILNRLLAARPDSLHADTVGGLARWWRRRSECRIEQTDDQLLLQGASGMPSISLELFGPWDQDRIHVTGASKWRTHTTAVGRIVLELSDCSDTVTIRAP